MGCGCGGGSTQAWSPTQGSTTAPPDADAPVSSTYPHIPVSQRPGRIGAPDWLPEPKGTPAIPTHEQ